MLLFFLVIEEAVTVALIFLVCYLLTELLAHTFVVFGAFKTAGAITSRSLQAFLYGFDNRFVFIKSYLHLFSSIFFAMVDFGT